jgi:hypothetical protein
MDGLEVNAEKTKYMLLSHHRNARQNHVINMANTYFENVAQFIYLGTTVTNQNLIQKEIKRSLNSGNVCYHSIQNIICLLNIYMTITPPQINSGKGYILCHVITSEFIGIFLEIQFMLHVKYIFVCVYLYIYVIYTIFFSKTRN